MKKIPKNTMSLKINEFKHFKGKLKELLQENSLSPNIFRKVLYKYTTFLNVFELTDVSGENL